MKYSLALIFSLCTLFVLAQPTLNESNMMPTISTIMNFNSSTAEIDSPAGENMMWDNTNVFGTPVAPYTVINPLWTPFTKDFSDANWALIQDQTTVFYNTVDTGLVYYGGVEGSDVVFYSDPQEYFSFPFTEGDTHYDEYAGNFSLTGVDYTRTGTIEATANGWGTMMLPNGTYDDVVRCEVVETLDDVSLVINYSLVFEYTVFYHPGTGFWIMQYGEIVYSDDQGGNQLIPFTVYLDDIETGIEDETSALPELNAYPNPAGDFLNLANATVGSVLQIFSLEGKLVHSGLIDGQPINVAELTSGTYSATVIGKNDVQSIKFIKR